MNKYYQEQLKDFSRFRQITVQHRMTILHDDGLYRHIRMARPGSSSYHFNVATIPGYLFFTGDMGEFTFSRTRDMFDFMRKEWDDGTPSLDYSYWAEKCRAADKSVGLWDFDDAAFREAALRMFRNHDWPDKQTRREAWTDEVRDLLERDYPDSREAIETLMEFSYVDFDKNERFRPFQELWDYGSFQKPGTHFKFACWAIAYTIRCYDQGADAFDRQAQHDKLILEGKL